jgi:hypothetical protein
MTDTTNNEPAVSKKPTHTAYTIRAGAGDKKRWVPIGAIWPHADGIGSTLKLDALPIDGLIIMRVIPEKE